MIDHLFVTLAAADPAAQPPVFNTILMFVAFGAIFYFLMIRPQQKQAKEKAALISSVKTGDKVVMSSGLHGIVANVKETTVLVKVADNVKLEFDKAAIAGVLKSTSEE